MDAVPSGSYLVLTHPTLELGGEGNAEAMAFWNENAHAADHGPQPRGVRGLPRGPRRAGAGHRVLRPLAATGARRAVEVAQFGAVARKR